MHESGGDGGPVHLDGLHLSPRGSGAITFLALAFSAGIAIAWQFSVPHFWPWIALATCSLIGAAIAHHPRQLRFAAICFTAFALGGAWLSVQHHTLDENDLARLARNEPQIIHARGIALRSPQLRSRTAGSMAQFDYRPAATYFPMRINSLLDRAGAAHPIHGEVLVRIDQTVLPFHAGDEIEIKGMLRAFPGPSNPGEFDYRRLAMSLGQAGLLTVPDRDLLTVTPEHGSWMSALLRWRDVVRRRAGAWLLADLPRTERTERDAMLAALLLGQRDHEYQELDDSFRRVGLAHIMAISGLHLGVLLGLALLIARLIGRPARWHGVLVILIVLMYLFIIEVRLPVLRAGVMMIAAGAAMATNRRLRVGGLIALSAIALLIWRPDQLFTPGFQLSFGVVLGLIHLSPRVRERWFGAANQDAASSAEMLGEWLKTMIAAACVAWLIATPIVLFHFGMISPLAVPLSVVALPIVALLLALGYAKMLLALLFPSVALIVGLALSVGAELLLTLVLAIDALPGSVIEMPPPGVMWSLCAAGWVVAWGLGVHWKDGFAHRGRCRALFGIGAVIIIWLILPLLPLRDHPPLRIDMLAVGDGSCYVVRSEGEAFIFDAGSSTDLNAGRRSLVPALHALGIRRVDAIAISHPDLDHYSAISELVDAFDVDIVYATDAFMHHAERDAFGPAARLLDDLTLKRAAILTRAAGDVIRIGNMTIEWLHPAGDAIYERDNDGSMVIRIEAAGRSIILTGDIDELAVRELMMHHPDLRADVIELPHHGSYNDAAASLVRKVRPAIALQSTGITRWQRDKWANELTGIERLITARDGACWVEFADDGAMRFGRYREE